MLRLEIQLLISRLISMSVKASTALETIVFCGGLHAPRHLKGTHGFHVVLYAFMLAAAALHCSLVSVETVVVKPH